MRQQRDLDYLREYGAGCHVEVSRDHNAEPCDRRSVAAAYDEDGGMYPVCKNHARGRLMVSLGTLLGVRR